MKQKIKIYNNTDSVTIDIEGTIGVPEQWQFDDPQQRVATYEAFRRTLQQIEELRTPKVIVNIRSTGGDVGDALLIYEALTKLDAEITTRCWGYVASAATVIAQAASEGLREISPNTLYLVHSSTCSAEGNAQELSQRVELLRKSDERLAELYARRSGREVESFVALMSEEGGEGRWLNSQETIAAGLADRETVAAAESEQQSDEPLSQRVAEGVESALRSVKGLIRRIGVQFSGAESVKSAEVKPIEAAPTPKVSKSQIEFEEEQRSLTPSEVSPTEDPTLKDTVLSPNERAYRDDARRLVRG